MLTQVQVYNTTQNIITIASSSYLATILILSVASVLAILAPTCSSADLSYLLSGNYLSAGKSLEYDDYKLTMQRDCNLVLYDDDLPVWSTGTNNKGTDCTLDMQDDGNLVIYDSGSGKVIWASNSDKGSELKYILVLQPDRNLVIYGPPIWATATNIDTDDGMAAVSISRNSTAKPAHVVAGDHGNITMVTDEK